MSTTPVYSTSLTKRYADGYLVAKATIAFGTIVKVVGLIVAVLLLLAGFSPLFGSSSGRVGESAIMMVAGGWLLAVIVGVGSFALGTLR